MTKATKATKATKEIEHNPDQAPAIGTFCEVIGGPHDKRYGVYHNTVEWDPTGGYPQTIVLRTRDDNEDLLHVSYKDVRPATAGRR